MKLVEFIIYYLFFIQVEKMENSSSQTHLSDQDASNSTSRLEATVWCTVFAVETVVIVTGNLLTFIIFARDARLRKPSSYLIMSLAIADLFIGLFTLPMWIYQIGLGILWHSKTFHQGLTAFFAIDSFTNLASISNLTAISLERLYATLLPWRHRATSRARFLLFILVVWMLPAVSSVLYIIVRFVVLSALGTMCTWLPYLCLLLLVICASYTAIFIKMRRPIHRRLDRECKLTITLSIATALSLVAYLPMVVLGVLYFALGKTMNNWFLNVLSFFNFGNSLVNPILYSFRMPDFRRAACSLFCTRRQRQQRPGQATIPQADNCASPLSIRMTRKTAVSPTTSPKSVVSGLPIPSASARIDRFKGPGYQREVGSPKTKACTLTHLEQFETDTSVEQSHALSRIRRYPNRETTLL